MPPKTTRKKVRPTIASVRRSQLITTYGIGALLPVESESFIVMGQNSWPDPSKTPNNSDSIEEPGLARLLRVERFYQPPSGDFRKLPLKRFPRWVSCPRCDRLDSYWHLARKKPDGNYENVCRHCEFKTTLVPSRFIAACSAGHITDFPYQYWVHGPDEEARDAASHKLKLISDVADGSLGGLIVRCSCGKEQSMAGSLGKGLQSKCFGSTPWLEYREGEAPNVDCDQPLTGLQRGASNVWYANERSAIRIDRDISPAERLVELHGDLLPAPEDEDYEALLRVVSKKGLEKLGSRVTPDELRLAHTRSLNFESLDEALEADLRQEEYEALTRDHPEIDGDELFVCKVHSKPSIPGLPDFIDSISEIPRLRIVKALTSFTRVEGATDEKAASAPLSTHRENWLPAIEIFGEGLFFRVNGDKIAAWERSKIASERVQRINRAQESLEDPRITSSRYLLLHSLAHVVMRELSLKTGYPATAIQERVYADGDQAGILLFTASADSAGSLGGLSSKGQPVEFGTIFKDAVENARWCSADPVCSESNVHGVSSLNLAACHYCMLAPEVSCENRNGNLDRMTLVGTLQEPNMGFFASQT